MEDLIDSPTLSEHLARKFHETYERLAPEFGYETRQESAKPWADVPDKNKRLMIAVCGHLLDGTVTMVDHTANVPEQEDTLEWETERSMKVRGKFVLNAVGEDAGSNPPAQTVLLEAIMDNDTPENARFAQATPSGKIVMHVSNPEALAAFATPGKFYYVDFIPADE